MPGRNSNRHYFVFFILLTIFLFAQVSWWIYFQVSLSKRLSTYQHELWNQQISTAKPWQMLHPGGVTDFVIWLNKTFPDLDIDREGKIYITNEAHQRLNEQTEKFSRMFLAEGSFFSLILLLGVIYIYLALRREIVIERRQATFLAAISHELKTPLTSMRLSTDTLLERDLTSEQQKELFEAIRSDVNRLQGLIEQLLKARESLEYSQSRFSEKVDMSDVLKIVISNVEPLIKVKNMNIETEIENNLQLMADKESLQMVVNNLLDNAIKYTPAQGTINVNLQRQKNNIVLRIADTGIGFKHTDRKRIFQRFFRVEDEDRRNTKGTGLGLYLVSEFVRAYGGTVKAHSNGIGQGAVFTVKLPLLEIDRYD